MGRPKKVLKKAIKKQNPEQQLTTANVNTGWEQLKKPVLEEEKETLEEDNVIPERFKNLMVESNPKPSCIKCGSIHRRVITSNVREKLGIVFQYVKCLECGQRYIIKEEIVAKNKEQLKKIKDLQKE